MTHFRGIDGGWRGADQREVYTRVPGQAFLSLGSLCTVAHDGVLCTFSNRSATDRAMWCGRLLGSVTSLYIFWRSKHFNQYLLWMRWWFSRSFKSFSLPFTTFNFFILFSSLQLHINLENAYWNPPQDSLLCDWSLLSSAELSLTAGKMCKN